MRRNIVWEGAGELRYEIREIVEVAGQLEKFGVPITWENIGDPVAKGEELEPWIKEAVLETASENASYGYTATAGHPETREFLAAQVNERGGCRITADDIFFFNGSGDTVSTLFSYLNSSARVIVPSPAYSPLSSGEALHAGIAQSAGVAQPGHHTQPANKATAGPSDTGPGGDEQTGAGPITYRLDPQNDWLPDLEELEHKVRTTESIAGILFTNPDNPTGTVYPRQYIEEIVRIAAEYDLFVISDETYANIVFNGAEMLHLSEVIGDVPGIAMRSISKEFPWPGARSGWVEIFNRDKDEEFRRFVAGILDAKRLEVCSTTLPQMVIPRVFSDPRYREHLRTRSAMFERRANEAYETFADLGTVEVSRPQGALYFTVLFRDGALETGPGLTIPNREAAEFIEPALDSVAPDKRFVYSLLAAEGICVVPLSGFSSELQGFRMTLLETDDEKRRWTLNTLRRAVEEYTGAAATAAVPSGSR